MEEDTEETLELEDLDHVPSIDEPWPFNPPTPPDEIASPILLDEQRNFDPSNSWESVDGMWAAAWHMHVGFIHRVNYELVNERYVKMFLSRYRLSNFSISKSLQRIMIKNRDLECVIRPLRITPAKERIFEDHHWFQFGTAPPETLSYRYRHTLHHPAPFMEASFFDADGLAAFSIFEAGEKDVLSNIGVFSPRVAARSLGTLTILKEVEYARERGASFYYFGPFTIHNPIYRYKTRFPGFELYDWDNDRWVDYSDPFTQRMLEQELPRRSD